MIRRSLAGQALRQRWGQAVVLLVLSGLITAAAVIGPLYERAVHEAVVRNALNRATVSAVGLSIHANDRGDVLGPQLLLPGRVRALYRPEVEGQGAAVVVATRDPKAAAECDGELHLDDGRPTWGRPLG